MKNINRIIEYVNKNDISTIVNSVISSKKDIWSVIEQIKDSRTEYQKKSQQLQDELVKHLPSYEVGMILEAKEDCLNNWCKGERVEIALVKGNDCVLSDLAAIDEKWIRKYFVIVGSK